MINKRTLHAPRHTAKARLTLDNIALFTQKCIYVNTNPSAAFFSDISIDWLVGVVGAEI